MRSTLFAGLILAATASYGAELPGWQTDWDAAFKTAREQHRLVFVNYTAGWCGKCHDVERLTFKSPYIMQHLADFVLLEVDVDFSKHAQEAQRGVVRSREVCFYFRSRP